MRLLELSLRDFRNVESVELSCDSDFVVLHGDNGQGKTNILEAIGMLATLKSFRTHRRKELIRWGCDSAMVEGQVESEGHKRLFRLEIEAESRKATVDGKSPEKLSDYFRSIRAILFAPNHIEMVRGSPETRREFLDRAVFTLSPAYLDRYREFKRLQSQKSALLRSGWADPIQLDILDEQLAIAGARVSLRRSEFVEGIEVNFREMHERLTSNSDVSIRYRSSIGDGSVEERAESYLELLRAQREESMERGWDTVGPQRDDLIIDLNDHKARSFASQGQARALVLALKLAELEVVRSRGGQPLFLLDDLSSELDSLRRERLIDLIDDLNVQCFVTTTIPELFEGRKGGDCALLRVENGAVESG